MKVTSEITQITRKREFQIRTNKVKKNASINAPLKLYKHFHTQINLPYIIWNSKKTIHAFNSTQNYPVIPIHNNNIEFHSII